MSTIVAFPNLTVIVGPSVDPLAAQRVPALVLGWTPGIHVRFRRRRGSGRPGSRITVLFAFIPILNLCIGFRITFATDKHRHRDAPSALLSCTAQTWSSRTFVRHACLRWLTVRLCHPTVPHPRRFRAAYVSLPPIDPCQSLVSHVSHLRHRSCTRKASRGTARRLHQPDTARHGSRVPSICKFVACA